MITLPRRCMISLAIAAVSLLLPVVLPAAGQSDNPEALVRLERTLSAAHALPGSTFLVAVKIEPQTDLEGVGVRETLPFGWTVHPVETDGAAFKRSENEWVFTDRLAGGSTIVLVYEVTVPPADRLYSDTLPTCFEIGGTFQATVPAFEIPIPGESSVEIGTALPIPTAVAHLIPGTRDEPDAIDLRLNERISQAQLERALELWSTDTTVPWTEGEIIDLAMMERLTGLYETCTEVDEPLPSSIDPGLVAIRTIETFLPCDSVLLPEGCFDPGLPARQFAVTVEITGSFDAYGIGLREWFPETWRITPVRHSGFVYRPSATEWIYPDRLPAGQAIAVEYLVEVNESTTDRLSTHSGCCGAATPFVGSASSGVECSERAVGGESEAYVWECLPVLLAISRWDVDEDRLDATLSDTLSFPQVQRAIDFWLSGTAVPHTCGYTVGYHMLKRIAAYWLAGIPVTEPLPEDAPMPCESPDDDCYAPACPNGDLCHLRELQRVEDYVGVPNPPRVSVEIEGACELTCATPATTLRAMVRGGTAPYRYEWLGQGGELLSTSDTLSVTEPGAYTAVVATVGGCRVGQRVVITQDVEAPQASIDVGGVLCCAMPEVALTASVLGGRPPFEIRWTGADGQPLGTGTLLTVDAPGRYTAVVRGANGCSGLADAEVLRDVEPPTAHAGPDRKLTCDQTEVALNGSATGGQAPYAYRWTNANGETIANKPSTSVDAQGTYTLIVTGANGCSGSDDVHVELDTDPPTVDLSASGSITCAAPMATLTATITGTEAPVTVTWFDPSGEAIGTSTRVGVAEAGTYTVRVRGGNGCTIEEAIAVAQDTEPPSVSATVSGRLTCDTAEVELRADVRGGRSPYAYEWRNGSGRAIATTETASVRQPGTYELTVTGANGCSASGSVQVSEDVEPPAVSASASGELTCAVTEVRLSATVSGGRAPYDVRWTDASGAALGIGAITVDQPGTYTATATGANGCSDSDSVTVSQDLAAPSVDAAASGELSCAAAEVTLSARIAGGRPPYSVVWSDSGGTCVGTSQTVTVGEPGLYTVTATGTNGCSDSDSVTVTEDLLAPAVRAFADGVLTCKVSEVTLVATVESGRPPYEIAWTDASGEPLGENGSITVHKPGTYTVTATGTNGCSASSYVIVTEDVAPPLIDLGPDTVLTCSCPEIFLRALPLWGSGGPYSYLWRSSCGTLLGTEPELCVAVPGTYSVTVTGANGCSSTASATVRDGIEPPQVDLGPDLLLTCARPDAVLCALPLDGCTGPYSYLWRSDRGDVLRTGPELRVGTAGTYTVTVTDKDGRSTTDSVSVHDGIEPPTVDLGPDLLLTCARPDVVLCAIPLDGCTGPYSYLWRSDRGDVLRRTGPELRVGTAGTYTVTVTDKDGRSTTDSVSVHDGIEPPTVDLGPDRSLGCCSTAIELVPTIEGGAMPYSYSWYNECDVIIGTDPTLAVTQAGTYLLIVRTLDGCIGSDSVVVREP